MYFALITFFAAFLIEGIGTYVSVVGLSSLFSSNPVIIALAIALDIGKLTTVSFLYKYWKKLNRVMRTYMLLASVILMVITSAGAAGYLSAEFQGAIVSTKESDIVVASLKQEQTKLENRKKEIDSQIANLPANMVRGRTKLIAEFKDEISQVNKRLVEIDKTLPEIEVKKAQADSHAGPILYIAQAFNTTVEQAVKYVILLIIFVFDPLAVNLIIGGNFLVEQHRIRKEEEQKERIAREEEERQRRYQMEMDEIHHRHEMEEERVEIEKLHVTQTRDEAPGPLESQEFIPHEEELLTPEEVTTLVDALVQDEVVEPEENDSLTISPDEVEPEPLIETEEDLDLIINADKEPEPEAPVQIGDASSMAGVDAHLADVHIGDGWQSAPRQIHEAYKGVEVNPKA